MIDMLTQRPERRRAVHAVLALLIGLGFSTPSLAADPKAPSVKSSSTYKKHRDRGTTIVIIDEDDRSSSTAPKPKTRSKAEKAPAAPSSRSSSDDDDDTRIIIRKTSKTSDKTSSGPKVIVVDRNSDKGCDGGGVCVIRP